MPKADERKLSDAELAERYKESHYLLFGDAQADLLDCDATRQYLEQMGFSEGALTQARHKGNQAHIYGGYRDPDACYCDFCGKVLSGVEYEKLKDGRDRCVECSQTVVKKLGDFESLFFKVRDGLCEKFSIDLPSPIRVKVISQAKMSRMQGKKFVPTEYFDPRTVGLAVNRGGSYSMYFEGGSPKASLVATTAHELTHIWQYSHWDWDDMQTRYGEAFLAVVEGMAKWTELQYLYLLNETAYADRFLESEAQRDDIYGYGLRLFLNRYPMCKGIVLAGQTPFTNMDNPIELE